MFHVFLLLRWLDVLLVFDVGVLGIWSGLLFGGRRYE
jgi:hypothetical protein